MAKPKRFAPTAGTEDDENLDPAIRSSVRELDAARRKLMSPPGRLGLPPLLDARRLEWGITDGAFAVQPYHDHIFVYQPPVAEKTIGGIYKPKSSQDREQKSAPKGILVAAGALALDQLRMNGVDLGHFVTFVRLTPWRIETDRIPGGETEQIIVLRAGDIVGSVDLGDAMRAGEVKLVFDKEKYEHFYKDSAGDLWHPASVNPWIPGDK